MLLQYNMMLIMLFVKIRVKCKDDADKKMVQALDNVPHIVRQWGHFLARNVINTKQKLGLSVKKPKNVKSRRVKKKLAETVSR